jgi:hypothetical protein
MGKYNNMEVLPYKKFLDGIFKKEGITSDELKKYKYCGGSKSSGKNTWNLFWQSSGGREYPKHKTECQCGVIISENCWIVNPELTKVLTVGNCCIKKFGQIVLKRTCEICKKPHKNRKDNFCNICRIDKEKIEQEKRRLEYENLKKQQKERLEREYRERQERLERENREQKQKEDELVKNIDPDNYFIGCLPFCGQYLKSVWNKIDGKHKLIEHYISLKDSCIDKRIIEKFFIKKVCEDKSLDTFINGISLQFGADISFLPENYTLQFGKHKGKNIGKLYHYYDLGDYLKSLIKYDNVNETTKEKITAFFSSLEVT